MKVCSNTIQLFFSFCESRLYDLEERGIYTLAVSYHQLVQQHKTEVLADFHADNPHVKLIISPGGASQLKKRAAELGKAVFLIPEYAYLKSGYKRYLERFIGMFEFVVEFSMDSNLDEFLEYTHVERAELKSIVGAEKLCPVWQRHHRLSTWDDLCKSPHKYLSVLTGESELVAKRKINSAHRHDKRIHLLNDHSPVGLGTDLKYDSFSSGYWRSGNTFSKIFSVHTGEWQEVPQSAIASLLDDQGWQGWFDKHFEMLVDRTALELNNKKEVDVYNALVWQGYIKGTILPTLTDVPRIGKRTAIGSLVKLDHEGKILRYALVETQVGSLIRRNDLIPDDLPFEALAGSSFHKVDPVMDLTVPTAEEGENLPLIHELNIAKKYKEFASRRALIQLREKGSVILECDTCQMKDQCPKFKEKTKCSFIFGQDQEMQLHDTMDILAQQNHLMSDALKMISRGVAENTAMDGGQFDPILIKNINDVFNKLGNLREAHDTELKGKDRRGNLSQKERGGALSQMLAVFAKGAASSKVDGRIVEGNVVKEEDE